MRIIRLKFNGNYATRSLTIVTYPRHPFIFVTAMGVPPGLLLPRRFCLAQTISQIDLRMALIALLETIVVNAIAQHLRMSALGKSNVRVFSG